MTELLITSSILILAITLVRALLRKRVGARLIYALWLLAALRLLLPFELMPSPVSVMNAAPRSAYVTGSAVSDVYVPADVPSDPEPVTDPWPASEPDAGVPAPTPSGTQGVREPVSSGSGIDRGALLTTIWLAGSALCAVYMLIVNGAMYFRLRGARRRIELSGAGLPVYLVRELPSPCLSGVFRPAIYLTPAALENEDRTQMAVLHETMHYRHGDHIWALLRCALLCVYWFDPFVWLAAYLSRRDAELACDESCVRALGDARRLDYGDALIAMLAHTGKAPAILSASTGMSGGKRAVRERVTRIVRAPRTRAAAVLAALVLVVIAAACTFTGADGERAEYLENPTAFTVIDGTATYSFDDHSYSYDSRSRTTTLTWADGHTAGVSTPTGLAPAVFMSDTLSSVAYIDTLGKLHIALSPDRENWTDSTVSDGSRTGAYLLTGFSTTETGWIYLAGSQNIASISDRLWLTEDGGETWAEAPTDMLPDDVTGVAVDPGGDVYVSTAAQDPGFEGADGFDGEITPLCPRATADGIEFPFLLVSADGSESRVETYMDLRSPYCNLRIPDEFTQSDTAVEIANGVYADFATEEKLAQFWDTEDFNLEPDPEVSILLYTNDEEKYSGYFTPGYGESGEYTVDGGVSWFNHFRRGIAYVIPFDESAGMTGVAVMDDYMRELRFVVTAENGRLSDRGFDGGVLDGATALINDTLFMLQSETTSAAYAGEFERITSALNATSWNDDLACCAVLYAERSGLTADVVRVRSRDDGELTYSPGEAGWSYTLDVGTALVLYIPEGEMSIGASVEIDGERVSFGFYVDGSGALRAVKLTEPGDTGHGVSVTDGQAALASSRIPPVHVPTDSAEENQYPVALNFYGAVRNLEVFSVNYDPDNAERTRGETLYTDPQPEHGTPLVVWNAIAGGFDTVDHGFSFTDAYGRYYEYYIDLASATMLDGGVPAVVPVVRAPGFVPEDTSYGVLADIATEDRLAEFDAWDSVDASLGAGYTTDVLLYSTTSIASVRVFTLDYSGEGIEPVEGVTLYTGSGLQPARPLVLTVPLDVERSSIGFAFADSSGREHSYYIDFYGSGDVKLCWLGPEADTSHEDFDTGYGLRINYASREILDRYDSAIIYRGFGSATEYVSLIAVMADEDLTDFRYFELAYEGDSLYPSEGRTIYDADEYGPEDLVIVGNLSPGETRQTRGLAFTDADGVEHKYMIMPNYESGGIALYEMD